MAKKIAITLFLSLILVFSVAALAACGTDDYSSLFSDGAESKYSAEDMRGTLEEFLSENADRTSLVKSFKPESGDGESRAAEWIAARITDMLEQQPDSVGSVRIVSTGERRFGVDTFESQNVIYSVPATVPSGKRIVIGAHYDNLYADVISATGAGYYSRGTGAEAAVGNGAAVAVLLEMCRYFGTHELKDLSVDVDFVFYGMGCLDYGGAQAYRESLGESGRDDLVLAITLDGLGGDKLWMYFDEQETALGKFMTTIAGSLGYGEYIGEPPVMQADVDETLTDKLPYTPQALLNESSVYFDYGNICTITSGSDFTFVFGNGMWYGKENAAYTSRDTLGALEANNPGYAMQMCIAADVLTCAVSHDTFAAACSADNGSYAWLTSRIAAYAGGALLAAGVLVFSVLMTKHLRKKYSDAEIKRNIKVAVFGMDYEDPKEGDVFVDIRPRGGGDDGSGSDVPFGDDPFDDGEKKK